MATSNDALDRVKAGNKGEKVSTKNLAVKSLEEIASLGVEEVGKKLARDTRKADSFGIEGGKMVHYLATQKPAGFKTIKKWVAHCTGIAIDGLLYKVAKSFGGLATNKSHGGVTEAEWDKVPCRWHIPTSSLLNYLEKEHKDDDLLRMECLEQVAVIMRTLPKDGSEKIRNILALLKPDEQGEGGGENESVEDPEEGPMTVDEMNAMAKRYHARIQDTDDIATLARAREVFEKLAAIADGRIFTINTPSEVAA